jgi:hypothetical protein
MASCIPGAEVPQGMALSIGVAEPELFSVLTSTIKTPKTKRTNSPIFQEKASPWDQPSSRIQGRGAFRSLNRQRSTGNFQLITPFRIKPYGLFGQIGELAHFFGSFGTKGVPFALIVAIHHHGQGEALDFAGGVHHLADDPVNFIVAQFGGAFRAGCACGFGGRRSSQGGRTFPGGRRGDGTLVQVESGFRVATFRSPGAALGGFLLAPNQFAIGGKDSSRRSIFWKSSSVETRTKDLLAPRILSKSSWTLCS